MVTSLSPPLSVGLIAATLRRHWSYIRRILRLRRAPRLPPAPPPAQCQRQCVAIVGLDRALEQPILHLRPHICPHVGLGTVRCVRESEIDFEALLKPKARSRS